MKMMKKIAIGVMNLSFVLVPTSLLAWGFYLATGPAWDVLIMASAILLWVLTLKNYHKVRRGEEREEQARALVAICGIIAAFFPLAAQVIFCHCNAIPCEASMTWLFLVVSGFGIYTLVYEKPTQKAITTSMWFGISFMSLVALAGMFDMFEYFTGLEIPERVTGIFGLMVPICVIGFVVLFIIGIIQDRLARSRN